MGWALLFLLAAFIAYHMVQVCSGRKALTVKFPSFRTPQSLFAHLDAVTAHNVGGSAYRAERGADGEIAFTAKVFEEEFSYTMRPAPVEHPYASCSYVEIKSVKDPSKVRTFWQLIQADRSFLGSILTVTTLGKVSTALYFEQYVRQLWLALRVCLTFNKRNPANATVDPVDYMKRSAANPAPIKRKRPGKAVSFVNNNSNEIIMSLIACASFWALYGFDYMLLLVPIILLHEYGHLVAYRMTGQTGTRMMLVPFMGGIAIASSHHKSEFDRAFCAIMGPAICLPLSIVLTIMAGMTMDHWTGWWFHYAAMICASMNALNLMPMLPLDGGHSLESIVRSIAPEQASMAMLVMTMGGGLLLINSPYEGFAQIILIWGIITVAQTWGMHTNAKPLSMKQGLAVACFHAGTMAIHAICAWLLYEGVLYDWFYENFY
jgi:Zn-dependent protease